jgi:hypothetical protein
MSTVAHHDRHVWTGAAPRTTRCAYMFCQAKPTKADLGRLRHEAEDRRRMTHELRFGRS